MPNINALALSVNQKLTGSSAGIVGATTVAFGAVLTTFGSAIAESDPSALVLMILILLCVLLSVLLPMTLSGLRWK